MKMNKITKLLLVIALELPFVAFAQEKTHYGVYLGGNINWMNIDKSLYYDDSEPFTQMHSIAGDTTYSVSYLTVNGAEVRPNGNFVIGGLFEYQIDDLLSLQFELLFNQQGYKLKGTVDQPNISDSGSTTYDYTANTKMSSISTAVMVKINALKNMLSVDLGVQPSFCFKMIKESERGISHKSIIYDSNNEFNPLNISLLGGLTGYLGDNFFVTARYCFGLTDLIKGKKPFLLAEEDATTPIVKYNYSEAKSTTNSIMLSIGYRFK